MTKSSDIVLAALLGATAGVVSTMLLSPRNGEENRDRIRAAAHKAKDKAEAKRREALSKAAEKTRDASRKASEKIDEASAKAKDTLAEGADSVSRTSRRA